MKEDIGPAPELVPRKRRALEAVPDLWLAQWSGRTLAPSVLRRVSEERARRKALVPDRAVGVLLGREGITPAQRQMIPELMPADTTEIHANHSVPLATPGRMITFHADPRDVVKLSKFVVVATRSFKDDNADPMWEWVRYARHRKVAVKVVRPDGSVE